MREMKTTDAEWLGQVPSDWQISTIGTLYTVRNDKVSDEDFEPLSVTMKGVVPQLDTAAKTDAHDSRKLVCKGDFCINSRSDRRGSCGIADRDGSVSLINTILSPRRNMNPNFYNWLFHTSMFADEFYRWGHGIVDDLWTTRWQEMKNIDVVVPPYDLQEKISLTLDSKVSKVDALIANQEAQIEKLKVYKQSLITEVVTKGLDMSVPMKDSGFKWIPTVPSDWDVLQIKQVASLKTGTTPPSDNSNYFGGEVTWYTPADFKDDEISQSNRTLTDVALYELGISLYPVGSTLLIGIGGTAGKVAYINKAGYSNQQITALIPIGVEDKYLFYYMLSIQQYMKDNAQYTTLPIINNQYLGSIKILLPSIDEQVQISNYLDKKCEEINKLVSIKQKKIEKLNQYKKSLIYEYVTGKKEVV